MEWLASIGIAALSMAVLVWKRDQYTVGIFAGGALAAGVVMLVVLLASDPCLPFCLGVGERRPWFAYAAAPTATAAWAALCGLREPLLRRSRALTWAALMLGWLLLLVAAAVAESAVEVTHCDCG